jgi:hypothetical protein
MELPDYKKLRPLLSAKPAIRELILDVEDHMAKAW